MNIGVIFLRSILVYFTVFLVLRLMGKREIGKLSTFDLVISIMIADISIIAIEDTDKSLLESFVPLATFVLFQILLAWISLKNNKVRRWFDGRPSMLIHAGKIDKHEMKRQRYNLDDLLLQLRMNGVIDLGEVNYAILETNGILTVIKKENGKRSSLISSNVRFEELPVVLIKDGKVQDEHLQRIGKNRDWLERKLRAYGAIDVRDVFFCTIDHRGQLFVDHNTP